MQQKQPSKPTELEMQLSQELEKIKEQLSAANLGKLQAEHEAEVSKKQLADLAVKYNDSLNQLLGFLTSEKAHFQELSKIFQEKDRSQALELEVLQKQRSNDLAALSIALNEIQTMKLQLEVTAEVEVTRAREIETAYTELVSAKQEMSDMLSLVEDVKMLLQDCNISECQARSFAKETLLQLEAAERNVELLQSEKLMVIKSREFVARELRESLTYGNHLEKVINQLKNDLAQAKDDKEAAELRDSSSNEKSVHFLKMEIAQLDIALEEMVLKYKEEKIQTTLEIHSAYETAKAAKSESTQRVSDLEAELKGLKEDVRDLKTRLTNRETELQCVTAENEGLHKQISKTCQCQYGEEYKHKNEMKETEATVVEFNAPPLNKRVVIQSKSLLKSKKPPRWPKYKSIVK